MKIHLVPALVSSLLPALAAFGQTTGEKHREVPTGRPAATAGPVVTSPPVRVERGGHLSVQVNVDATGNNILGDAANEPSIAIDPTDPRRAVIGWRQFDSVFSSFREGGYAWTDDGGQTWTFPGVLEEGVFRSDPVLDVDADGRFFYNSLTGGFVNTIHVSTDGGRTFDMGTFAFGGDKQWMGIDRTGGTGHGNVYANWTRTFSTCDGQFTLSYDDGMSYEDCIDVPGAPRWGTIAVDADGAVYIAGTGFVVAKSTTLRDPGLPPAFDFATPIDLGGPGLFGAAPNPGGLGGQTWIDVDVSGGPRHGDVYLLSTVDPPGNDPADVVLARSTDGGLTWSDPIRVNDDPPGPDAWQWFATMAVAPDGRIDVVWNDTRNSLEANISELYYASSRDGGRTWFENTPITPAFDSWLGWPQQNKLGDYYDMVSDDRAANVAYAATFNGEQDVYFTRIEAPSCADADGDSFVAFTDLLAVIGGWGPCDGCSADFDGDGVVGVTDLLLVLAGWGRCPLPCCLPTDACADAPTVGDGPVRFSTLLSSSGDPSLPARCDEGGGTVVSKDVWIRYAAACDGVVTASICEADFDTRLAAYDDADCPGGLLACSDDACGPDGTRSELTFEATAGRTYLIRVGGNAASGQGVLVLTCDGG
ncbi:MAG: exo-alpha-sialidase [Phycisphaerales bacterium]|nr:exo-alpha-sialidase [Phycisphaerales bacterium]